jgi:peroxiredoxin
MQKFQVAICFQISLLLMSSVIAQSTKKQINKSFTLSGKIEGVKNEKIYLSTNDAEENVLDSTYAKDGKFSFKGKISEPTFYILKIAGTRNQTALFLEPGNITLIANKDSLGKAIVKGSKSNDEWLEWGKAWKQIAAQAGPMYRRLDSATERGKVTASSEERKIFDDGMKSLNDQTAVAVTDFIKKHPQSSVAPFIIYDRYISFPDSVMEKKTFAMLGTRAKNSLYGKKITEYRRIAAKTGIGAMPDFTVADTSGKLMKLSSLRGKYVLVDFWASWCAPCRKENPNVVKAYQKYHDKGFEIVGVSLDTKKDAWMKAIEKDNLTWNHVSDLKGWESGIVKEFGITVVPTSFLLDKEGKVIANNLREEALPKKLEQLLK